MKMKNVDLLAGALVGALIGSCAIYERINFPYRNLQIGDRNYQKIKIIIGETDTKITYFNDPRITPCTLTDNGNDGSLDAKTCAIDSYGEGDTIRPNVTQSDRDLYKFLLDSIDSSS